MRCSTVLAFVAPILALPTATLDERGDEGTPTVPVQLPTGTVCLGAAQKSPVTAAELAAAVAGCTDIQPRGTNLTRNDIVDGVCKKHTLLFARGTSEDPNLGNLVGPPFVAALESVFGQNNVAVQGVNDYAASGPEYCAGGSLSASQNLADLITQTRARCPRTTLTVSGYSQGAQVVHNAFALLAAADAAAVASVVLFGDPDRNLPLAGVPARKVAIDCHPGDDICADGEDVLVPHATYCHDVLGQALFVKSRSSELW